MVRGHVTIAFSVCVGAWVGGQVVVKSKTVAVLGCQRKHMNSRVKAGSKHAGRYVCGYAGVMRAAVTARCPPAHCIGTRWSPFTAHVYCVPHSTHRHAQTHTRARAHVPRAPSRPTGRTPGRLSTCPIQARPPQHPVQTLGLSP